MLPISVSLFVGLVLTLIPGPPLWNEFRPEWVALLVLYWTLHAPKKFGIVSAWVVGIGMDILTGSLLGQHAIGYIVLSYLSISISQQYPLYSILQQVFIVFVSLSLYFAIYIWVSGISGASYGLDTRWYPIVLSTLLWPWLSKLLDQYRH